ncbi:hypothetical protein Misp01_55430 [Microtetraspora sp. NBRC 13810]|uniref:helix-turn-helix domain-containing protein n=1 Tax=Microtetraspora sp. NBRC 13810 TaxID=3030990 RepID=UPI0024A377B9|nr:helix-turn-helix transcriptional regulator [Microtetraspora sp. NBRC 13810]GLW10415.1 hypothetical protein Misp01_55430 [Microtetraspora sp. NBRC 13810]
MALPKVGSIGEYIRDQRTQAKISLRQLASAAGVSNPYLSQIERGLRKPSAEILNQIAKGLQISAQALYVQAGLIEDGTHESDVITTIRADTHITERQRQVLIDIYESFRKENHTDTEVPAEEAHDAHTGPAPEAGDPSDDDPVPDLFATLQPFTATAGPSTGNGNATPETKEG